MKGLRSQKILVAGGATGIGAAAAERLAAEGAAVVIGDINVEGAEATAKRITSAGGRALAVRFDLADEGSIHSLVDRTLAELGGVDGLYNVGADVSPDIIGRDGDVLNTDLELWVHTLDVDLLGYARTCRAVLPHLLSQGGGVIVNTSSGAATAGLPDRAAYAAAKAGVEALTRHIASRWGKEGIRCNGVSPGLVMGETQFRQMDRELQAQALQAVLSTRLGEPADVAAAVAFLFSDDAAWVNGQTWSICGGMTRRG